MVIMHYSLMQPSNKYFNLDLVSRTNISIASFSDGSHDSLFSNLATLEENCSSMFMLTFSSDLSISSEMQSKVVLVAGTCMEQL